MPKVLRLRGADYTEYMQNKNNDRQKWQKTLWDEAPEGPGRIYGPNGRVLAFVREDPGVVAEVVAQSTEPEDPRLQSELTDRQVDAMKRQKNSGMVARAPSPRACHCATWPWEERQYDERRKPKLHHPKCAFAKAWMRQKGHGIKQVPAGPTLVPTIHKAGVQRNLAVQGPRHLGSSKSRVHANDKKVVTIPAPEKCPKCSHFTKSRSMDKELHHPTCQYYKPHRQLRDAQKQQGIVPAPAPSPVKQRIMLINLETQAYSREAERDEVEEARRRLRDEGAPLASVDDEDYLVAFEDGSSLEPAEEETPAPLAPRAEHETSDTEPPTADPGTFGAEGGEQVEATGEAV